MVVCLVWDPEECMPEADGFNKICTFLVLKILTLLYSRCTALGVRCGFAGGFVSCDLNLLELGDGVGDGVLVNAGVGRDVQGGRVGLQMTILPSDLLTVLITIPNLLPSLVDHPLAVTLLLGHVLADGDLVVLCEGLGPALETLLTNEGFAQHSIVVVVSCKGHTCTISICHSFTGGFRDTYTGSVLTSVAASTCSIGADIIVILLVQYLAVPGDIHTIILVTVSLMIPAREGCDESY